MNTSTKDNICVSNEPHPLKLTTKTQQIIGWVCPRRHQSEKKYKNNMKFLMKKGRMGGMRRYNVTLNWEKGVRGVNGAIFKDFLHTLIAVPSQC